MGGVILFFILVLLVTALVTPAIRTRFGRQAPPDPENGPPHEEVVRRLDDHRSRRKDGEPKDPRA